MKKILNALVYSLLYLTGCESTVQNFNIKEPDPKLAVYSSAGADSSLRVYVSRNMALNEKFDLYPQPDALVELYKGSELLSSPVIYESDFFIDTGMRFEENTAYTLIVSKEGYPTTESHFYIPEKPIVHSIDTSMFLTSPWWSDGPKVPYVRIIIRFENPVETDDFFSIEVNGMAHEYFFDPLSPRISQDTTHNKRISIESKTPYIKTVQSDEDFYNISQPSESYGDKFFFSDELLEDGENTLIIDAHAYSIVDVNSDEKAHPFTVTFAKIDKNVIEYAYSKGKNHIAEENPFVEPVTIFSNVENGLGIVSGYNIYSKTYSSDIIYKLMPEDAFSY